MAHTNQQRKRNRQNEAQYAVNRSRRARVSTYLRAFEAALKHGKAEGIAGAFKAAMAELAKAAQKGALTKGAAARTTSRLARKIATRKAGQTAA